jgi:hypothetical protein
MAFFASAYHSRIYRDFRGLEIGDFQGVIRFFEQHEQQILELSFEEYFEIMMGYCDALFEAGAYQKHVLMADVVIELSIRHNIHYFEERDVFRYFLFRKAAALYNLFEGENAEHILRELIKMDATDREALFLYTKCRQRCYPWLINHFRAVSILMFLITAIIVAAEVLLVVPFYTSFADALETVRIGTFISAVCTVFTGNVVVALLAKRDARRLITGISQKQGHSFS